MGSWEQVVAKHDRPGEIPFEERRPVVPLVLCEPILDADDRIGVDPSANAVDQPTWKDPLSGDPIPLSAREVTGRDIETERKVDSRSKAASVMASMASSNNSSIDLAEGANPPSSAFSARSP
ncbi:MAG: hypothetical protein R2848_05665 [Thermomicrobiales bacterium]